MVGSYHGYGNWRRQLADMLGTTPEDIWNKRGIRGPFVELINFADNEGFIGPETSAKLASDFEAFRKVAKEFSEETTGPWDGDEWYQVYKEFLKAFKLAAECNGIVRFS